MRSDYLKEREGPVVVRRPAQLPPSIGHFTSCLLFFPVLREHTHITQEQVGRGEKFFVLLATSRRLSRQIHNSSKTFVVDETFSGGHKEEGQTVKTYGSMTSDSSIH